MDGTAPHGWTTETSRTYSPADTDRELRYRTYRHRSAALRLKVAPASLEGDTYPGYALTATTDPGRDGAETTRIRTVLTFDRCEQLAQQFMTLFSTTYGGPDSLETALEYAEKRTRSRQ